MLGELGTDACRSGSTEITDETSCEAAATRFGYTWDASEGDKSGSLTCNYMYCTGYDPHIVRLPSGHGALANWLCLGAWSAGARAGAAGRR